MIGTAARTAGAITNHFVSARGWYTVSQAAHALGYNRKTVWRMIQDGRLPAHRLNNTGEYRISKALVDAMVADSTAALKREMQSRATRVIRRSKGTPLSG